MWKRAMWHLYDHAMSRTDRLTCFRRMVSEGLTKRQAAEEIVAYHLEP